MKFKDILADSTYPEHKASGYYLVSGCWHMPFQNNKLLKAYLGVMEDLVLSGDLRGHFLLGDILDMHSISRHSKGKITVEGLTLSKEYREANKVFDMFDSITSGYDLSKEYIYGNHEDWYEQYMSGVDANKLGKGVVKSPKEALRLEARGYNVQTSYKNGEIQLGDLTLLHGVWHTKHAAAKHLQEMRRSAVFAHTHRQGTFRENGIEAHNIGWGGDKRYKVFNYMSKEQKQSWENGFAVIYVDDKGVSHLQQITLKDGKCFFNGKLY